LNERERRELLVGRHLDLPEGGPWPVDGADAVLLGELESASADFLGALPDVVIPVEALDSEATTRRAYDSAARRSPEAAVLLSSFGRRADLALATRELEAVLARCLEGVPYARRALDFGCGLGRLTRFLQARSDFVVSVDLSFELLRRAPGAQRVQASSADFVAPGCRFGLVLAADVLPAVAHLPGGRRERMLAGLFDLLEPAGALLVVNHDYVLAGDASAALISDACGGAAVQWRFVEQTLWRGAVFVVRAP
jgi:SAM-dependent methyltransferase